MIDKEFAYGCTLAAIIGFGAGTAFAIGSVQKSIMADCNTLGRVIINSNPYYCRPNLTIYSREVIRNEKQDQNQSRSGEN